MTPSKHKHIEGILDTFNKENKGNKAGHEESFEKKKPLVLEMWTQAERRPPG